MEKWKSKGFDFKTLQEKFIPLTKEERSRFFDQIANENYLRLMVIAAALLVFEMTILFSSPARTPWEFNLSWFLLAFHTSAIVLAFLARKNLINVSGQTSQVIISLYALIVMIWGVRVGLVNIIRAGNMTLYIVAMTVTSAMFFRRIIAVLITNIGIYLYFIVGINRLPIEPLRWGLPGLGDGPLQARPVIRPKMYIHDGLLILVISCIIAAIVLQLRLKVYREHEELKELSNLDAMTKLLNHVNIHKALEMEMERANRYEHPLSVLMLDIDCFKAINDTYGHLFGDKVIKRIANILSEHTREGDMVGRYGGEEFLILLPETNRHDALAFSERLRTLIQDVQYENGARITVSIGLKTLGKAENLSDYLEKIDKALYEAKDGGRNRVVVAT